ncbi:threonine synthase [candidate division TA06 bacterium]|nr:threonine synthase [candidate division TA06 bacterium]
MKFPLPYKLHCGWCGRSHPAEVLQQTCTDCRRPLLARFELNPTLGKKIRERLGSSSNNPHSPHSLWRYSDILPVANPSRAITLGEGGTPLLKAERLGSQFGVKHLWFKDESQNPTGSFKARGMSVAISRAIELGARRFCVPSAGNAAGAAAAYVAQTDCELRVYMPADSGEGFFSECRAFGAEVMMVEGTIATCAHRMEAECSPEEWFDLSTLKEPYRLEGKKTMGFELYEDFGGELPDVILYPTGGGTGLIGMWKAFQEMREMGWLENDDFPRMVSVQTAGCAPIVHAFERGEETAKPIDNPQTAALGLRVPGPIGDFLILRAIRESGGAAVMVTEAEWVEGQGQLARDLGIFASPEGGAALAGLRKILDNEIISGDERIVIFNTGTGFKYPPTTWPTPPPYQGIAA